MAKNQGIDPKAATAARIKRTEAYAEKVRLLFAQTVNDILALNKTMPKLDDGVMFSFDGESLKKQKEVEALLRRLHSSVTMAIRECVRLEWAQANAEADRLIKSVFGQRVLDSPEFTAWTQRNTAARDAFLARSEKGLNLSDRVWKSVRQLRDEMEVAVTVSMGEGKSANAMSREVRQYLNDPDLMFRRFRYKKGEDKDGNPVYGRKWKKRIKDEATGKYKWIDYDMDSYRTGHGVYKSSAKNAMRLTRTETNIAYRRADHERWQQMDFVLGQRVQLSKNHPRKDICDKLQGDYPKEFVFDGWHPQCYSDDSEVLTADGWKFFKDVCDDDMILSLNPDTRNVEYVGVIDRQRYEKHGVMQHFFNRSLDCLVTDEHQMVYLNKSDGAIKRCRADEYRQGKGAFYRGCEYQSIIVNRTKTICEYTIAFDDYCEFMGYWLADGSLERHSGIHIAKKMGLPLRNDIIACIERMGFSPKERENGIVFYNTEINAFLEAFGRAHDKFIPSDILNATRSQIGVFLNAFIACDGHVRNGKPFVGNRGSKFEPSVQERLYYTTSPKMSGQLGELILKIGKRPSYAIQKASTTVKKDGKAIKGNHDCWKIAECNSVTATVFSKEFVQYDGFVYDLSLERNHIMYVRRNGKCFWGSNCFCFVTPILVDAEELAKVNEAFLKGEKYIPKGQRVTEYPDNFKDWVMEHAADIADARDRGTEPYFIRNNAAVIDKILNPKPKELTIAEKAALRHAARTPEQREVFIREYNERKATRKYGERILGYMDGISDVDTTALRTALKGGDMSAIMVEAQKLKAIGKEILALDKLDNPMMVARATSKAEAITINDAVTRTMAKMPTDLDSRKSQLEFEIGWVGKEGKRRYPGTWKFSQDAYKKELAFVQRKIDIRDVTDSVADALAYSVTTHSKAFKAIADEMKAILSSPNIDLAAAKAKATELNDKYNQLKSKYKSGKVYKSKSIKHETVADLQKRLGAKMPKTLPNLEAAIAKFEKTSDYGAVAKQHKAEIEDLMRRLFDTHDLGMNIDDDTLEAVLNSWFKNQFEVGTGGGAVYELYEHGKTTGKIGVNNGRLRAAHRLFGLGKDLANDQLTRREYEKYGNLLDHDILRSITHNTATGYGNVEVRFKKDKVIATWTAGDSLGCDFQPSLVSDPRSCSFDNLYKTPDSGNIQTDDLVKFKRDHISSYLELQYHGNLTVDCVESLTYPYDLTESRYSKHLAIAKEWKAAGAKIYYVANGKLCQL